VIVPPKRYQQDDRCAANEVGGSDVQHAGYR